MGFLMHYDQCNFLCVIYVASGKPCDENVSFVTDKSVSCKVKLTSGWGSGLAKV